MAKLSEAEIAEIQGQNRRTINKRASREGWKFQWQASRGGKRKVFDLADLPEDIQEAYIARSDVGPDLLPGLSPGAAMAAVRKMTAGPGLSLSSAERARWRAERAIGPAVLEDKRVMKIGRILQEVEAVPAGWARRTWIEAVALKHHTTYQTIYKWIRKYKETGLAGLVHTKTQISRGTAWDDAALEWWIGLCLKHEHTQISRKHLYYNVLIVEANRRGWRIGGERSALAWAKRRLTPQLAALQKRGPRGLDNMLPPVRRSYADLRPFQIIVGDQHRFDFWVTDDDTGELFRPEGYFWQDLRTRMWYGGAIDRKYDSHLMGLALHMGCRAVGPFETTYNDNGKPEQSKYIMSIVRDINRLGMSAARTDEAMPAEMAGMDDAEDMPLVRVGQRFAIPRNAKAKMIEGSFNKLEGALRDVAMLPGYVRKLGGDSDENSLRDAEVQRLAAAGKLPTFSEFRLAVYRTLDWMNREQQHRGLAREWDFPGPKPEKVTPMAVLMACYQYEGWRPRSVSAEALDLIFLARARRKVIKGQIEFQRDYWETDEARMPDLMRLEGQFVELRYDPMAACDLLVFHRGAFVCVAEPIAWSSMIDRDRASELIARKRRRKRMVQDEFKRLTAGIADVRTFSQIPAEEKAAALVGTEKKRRADQAAEQYHERTPEEISAEVAKLERLELNPAAKVLPERPLYFLTQTDRYSWIVKFEAAGGELPAEDAGFRAGYEANMDAEQAEYWAAVREHC